MSFRSVRSGEKKEKWGVSAEAEGLAPLQVSPQHQGGSPRELTEKCNELAGSTRGSTESSRAVSSKPGFRARRPRTRRWARARARETPAAVRNLAGHARSGLSRRALSWRSAKQRLHKRRPRGVRDTARAFRCRATWSAWRLCAGDGGACRERADQLQRRRPAGRRRLQRHWEAGRGRVRRGGRPNRCQSRTRHLGRGKPRRLVLVQKPQELRQMAAECPKLQQTREGHGRGAAEREGLVGSSWRPNPWPVPTQRGRRIHARQKTVLELRLGARFGSGAGERDRERALEEAAVVTAARGRAVAASWLDSSRRGVEDATGGAVVAAEAACEPAAVPALFRTLEMPSATESSSSASAVSWAASRRKSSPRDMVPKNARQRAPKRGRLRWQREKQLNPKDREWGIPSMRIPASREITSGSVELCETEVCFLYIQLIGTNVWLPNMHKSPNVDDFESSRSPAKSESWNNSNLQCCAVFPT